MANHCKAEIGRKFRVSPSVICSINSRVAWGWLEDERDAS
jgi:hypothetical protein